MTPRLADQVREYIALRRRFGYDLSDAQRTLLSFARHADALGHRGPLTVDLAVHWARATVSWDPCAAARRLAFVRQFARHRAAFDPGTQIPPPGLLGPAQIRRPPHIYSCDEISALLRETARLGPPAALRPHTLVTLLGLLASTGLRVSEACSLARRDVDLDEGILTVRGGKLRKVRRVPMHPTATAALRCYATLRDARCPHSDAFFRTDRSGCVTSCAVDRAFGIVRKRLGWTRCGRTRPPRVHDLRHTFVVRCLLRWYEQDQDVGRRILALSTFLGHSKVSSTYWYVSAIPELLAVTSRRFARFAAHSPEDLP